jgi:hypothetical protein
VANARRQAERAESGLGCVRPLLDAAADVDATGADVDAPGAVDVDATDAAALGAGTRLLVGAGGVASGVTQFVTQTGSMPMDFSACAALLSSAVAASLSERVIGGSSSSVRSISIPRPAQTSGRAASGRSAPVERTFTHMPATPWRPSDTANAMAAG